MTDKQYDDAILDSNAIDPTDVDGNPIPVTIPIMLAPGVKSRVHHATWWHQRRRLCALQSRRQVRR